MPFRPDLEAIVLAALQDGSLHGYGIVKQISKKSDRVLQFGEGQLYPILHKMEERGWIQGRWEPQEGKPPRRIYELTDEGREQLERKRSQWTKFHGAIKAVMAGSAE
jgi:transcriptional regulator